MKLYGELLSQPELRFDYSSTSAKDTYSKKGLITYGPYDSMLFPYNQINFVVLFPLGFQEEKQILVDGLMNGEGNFRGFKSLFRIPLTCVDEVAFKQGNVERLVDLISSKDPNIVYVLLHRDKGDLYKKIKLKLLANGIPSQMVTIEKLREIKGRQYTLENIALASYAKIGGTPWTISSSCKENNLILGVSRAQDASRKYLVGFVTLFTNDGDFLFIHSKAPVIGWDEYVQGLSDLIQEAIVEYKEIQRVPDSIIVHFHKRPGKREIDAIENALKSAGEEVPYAIIHLNEYTNFRLFDTSHFTYIPIKGLKVNLSFHEALLLLDGRIGDKRQKIGVPRVLDIRVDKRSTLNLEEKFSELVKQIYDFAHINWRGFNATAIPVTLNYSKLIARMVIDLGIQNWNQIIAEGRLRDKSWFL